MMKIFAIFFFPKVALEYSIFQHCETVSLYRKGELGEFFLLSRLKILSMSTTAFL